MMKLPRFLPVWFAACAVVALAAGGLAAASEPAHARSPVARISRLLGMNDPGQRALLVEPQSGDLYAADLTYFSDVGFGDDDNTDVTHYGLMRVVTVNARRIIVNTESDAWPDNPRGALDDLYGDLKDITWDEEEDITINREDLLPLFRDNKILGVRRLEE